MAGIRVSSLAHVSLLAQSGFQVRPKRVLEDLFARVRVSSLAQDGLLEGLQARMRVSSLAQGGLLAQSWHLRTVRDWNFVMAHRFKLSWSLSLAGGAERGNGEKEEGGRGALRYPHLGKCAFTSFELALPPRK